MTYEGRANEMNEHGPITSYQLSPEELAEYDRKLGKPTESLNAYKGRIYSSPPKDESPKKCSMPGCKKKVPRRNLCSSHYYKAKKGMRF